jgi:TRAP-type C4-dicarboxylate transport system permease small subunit
MDYLCSRSIICQIETYKEKIMSISRDRRIIYYVIAAAVIIIAFLLLGGASWMQGMGHGKGSMGTVSLRWGQILISLGLGFLLGWVASKKKW